MQQNIQHAKLNYSKSTPDYFKIKKSKQQTNEILDKNLVTAHVKLKIFCFQRNKIPLFSVLTSLLKNLSDIWILTCAK